MEHVLDRDLVRLLAMVDGAREALLCLAADGAVLHLNPAAEELFGVHALEVLGRAWDERLPAWLAPALAESASRATEEPGEEGDPEGEERWWVSTLDGEHELRRRELGSGERLVFVSLASPSPQARAAHARTDTPAWDSVHRSPRAAERFSEWSELALGEARGDDAVFTLGPALGERPLLWQEEAAHRGLAFRLRVASAALERPLVGEARHALRALEELVDNALGFTARGGAIELCIESESAGVACRVRSSGEGLGPGEWELARRPFARLHDPLDGRTSGAGLGLALVDAHLECLSARPFARRDFEGEQPMFSVSFHLLGAHLVATPRIETVAAIG